MKKIFLLLPLCMQLLAAAQKPADLLVYNARIYTVDQRFTTASAMVIRNGKILATGNTAQLRKQYKATSELNAHGKFIYPGFIDAHTHFYRYGLGLQTADLVGTKSWDDVLSRLKSFSSTHPHGWLIGRGWDQNDWPVKEYPTKAQLDLLFPERPVYLTRVDGHAAIANQKALDAARVTAGQTIEGGQFETRNGQLTGILIDNAKEVVSSKIPGHSIAEKTAGLMAAQENCFAVGLTTVDDCGLDAPEVLLIDSLQQRGQLKMRVYAMLSDDPANYEFLFARGIIKTPRLNVRAFKVYADGALGSRGAVLLKPYSDKPGWTGFLLSAPQHFDSVARRLASSDFQMCTHAIGDSANRTLLHMYGKYLQPGNDRRWRIEHAQVVHPSDIHLFGKYRVIPSVQPTHATSDMYWAAKRLGRSRVKTAYAFQQLMEENRWIPLGTDFPVEDISPFKTFLAAVFRVDDKGYPAGGFQKENGLSRQQALRGMTIWAARSNFEEKEKGSLEAGKLADFIILDQDLMQVSAANVLKTKVIATYSGGEKVYEQGAGSSIHR